MDQQNLIQACMLSNGWIIHHLFMINNTHRSQTEAFVISNKWNFRFVISRSQHFSHTPESRKRYIFSFFSFWLPLKTTSKTFLPQKSWWLVMLVVHTKYSYVGGTRVLFASNSRSGTKNFGTKSEQLPYHWPGLETSPWIPRTNINRSNTGLKWLPLFYSTHRHTYKKKTLWTGRQSCLYHNHCIQHVRIW